MAVRRIERKGAWAMRCVRRIERLLVFVIAALAVLVAPTAVPLFAQEA